MFSCPHCGSQTEIKTVEHCNPDHNGEPSYHTSKAVYCTLKSCEAYGEALDDVEIEDTEEYDLVFA